MPDLTQDSILVMEAGPKLDVLVAERVMGWDGKDKRPRVTIELWQGVTYTGSPPMRCIVYGHRFMGGEPWSPSTDIAAAMGDVWPKLRSACTSNQLMTCRSDDGGDVEVNVKGYPDIPAAICRAALLTTLQTIPQESS